MTKKKYSELKYLYLQSFSTPPHTKYWYFFPLLISWGTNSVLKSFPACVHSYLLRIPHNTNVTWASKSVIITQVSFFIRPVPLSSLLQ